MTELHTASSMNFTSGGLYVLPKATCNYTNHRVTTMMVKIDTLCILPRTSSTNSFYCSSCRVDRRVRGEETRGVRVKRAARPCSHPCRTRVLQGPIRSDDACRGGFYTGWIPMGDISSRSKMTINSLLYSMIVCLMSIPDLHSRGV